MKTNNITQNPIADDKLSNLILTKANGATYVLLIEVNSFQHLCVGKLGWVNFEKGYYIYIGSSKKSIKKRLLRHISTYKKKFWHIDYLLSIPHNVKVINIFINKMDCECKTIQELLKEGGVGTVVRDSFGSSDCNCRSHLLRLDNSHLHLFYQLMLKMNFYSLL